MIAITVSVNFASILELVIPLNIKHFEKWFIITDLADKKTVDLCHQYGKGVIEPIYFDFEARGYLFNKGGGLRMGQLAAYYYYPESWFLILDADILLPDNLDVYLDRLEYFPDTLYGVETRRDYPSLSAFRNNVFEEYVYGDCFTGFFQLYADPEKYYDDSHSIDKCDDLFREKFMTKKHLRGLHVRHLGKSGIGSRYLTKDRTKNWDGAMQEDLFQMDSKINIQDLKYKI